MRCVIYCRVSTDKQREAGTIESQREVLLDYARRMGWAVVAVEQDDGFSGTVPAWDRPGMSAVLGLVERREVDCLLVVDIDRTSRAEDPVERALLRKALRDAGAVLATPKGILRDETPEEKLTQDMLSSIASYERSKIRERTVRGRKDGILRKGVRPLTQTPIGFQWDSKSCSYIAAPAEQAVVREVFRLAAEGQGPLQIERALKRQGITSGRTQMYRPRGTPKGTPKVPGQKFIVRRTIADMLANRSYCGTPWAPNPKWYPDFTVPMEALVSKDAWEAANAGIRSRPHPPARHVKYDYLLRAVVHCAHCGRKLRGHTTVRDRNAYYRCSFAARDQVNCPRCTATKGIRADAVEKLVWDYVRRLILEPGFLRAEVERAVDANMKADESVAESGRHLRAELTRLAAERGRLQTGHRKGLYTDEELAEHLGEIERERAPLASRLELLSIRERAEGSKVARLAAVEDRLRAMREAVDSLDRDGQRAVIAELVERVVIDTMTGEVVIRVLVGDAPAAGGDGSDTTDPGSTTPPSSGVPGRPGHRAAASIGYANGISPG